jgi:hypothetical protein
MAASNSRPVSIDLTGILFPLFFLLLTYLKLTGRIDASWWVVTAPLWIPPVALFCLLIFILVLAGLGLGGAALYDKWQRR